MLDPAEGEARSLACVDKSVSSIEILLLKKCEVGIDLEPVRPVAAALREAALAPAEAERVRSDEDRASRPGPEARP